MQHLSAGPALDIQEALKILRFRFRLDVGFRPAKGSDGVLYYSVDGKLRAESEILRLAERGRTLAAQGGSAS